MRLLHGDAAADAAAASSSGASSLLSMWNSSSLTASLMTSSLHLLPAANATAAAPFPLQTPSRSAGMHGGTAGSTAAAVLHDNWDHSLLGSDDDVFVFKMAALATVIVVSLLGSFMPLRLNSISEHNRALLMELSRFFTAGVFLGVGLLHMLPEAAAVMQRNGWGQLPNGDSFPVAHAVCALGFVAVWYIEQRLSSSSSSIPLPSSASDYNRMVAVAAGAESSGGGSICFVQVQPVASYGPIICSSSPHYHPSRKQHSPPSPLTTPLLPPPALHACSSSSSSASSASYLLSSDTRHALHSVSEASALAVPVSPHCSDGMGAERGGESGVPLREDEQREGLSAGGRVGGVGEWRASREYPSSPLHHQQSFSHRQRHGHHGHDDHHDHDGDHDHDGHDGHHGHDHDGHHGHDHDGHHCHEHGLSDEHEGGGLVEDGNEGDEGHEKQRVAVDCEEGRGLAGGRHLRRTEGSCTAEKKVEEAAGAVAAARGGGGASRFSAPPQLQAHSHSWVKPGGVWEGVKGGSSADACSALHSHTHETHHHHIVLQGTGSLSLLLAALFSLHSFVVGAALGTEVHLQGALSLLIAIIAHKGAEAFSVGVQFVRENVPLSKTIAVILLYCSMTPLGIVIGMLAAAVQGPLGMALSSSTQALGAGSVLYIVMVQLSEKPSQQVVAGVWQLVLFLLGLVLMAAVALVL